MKGDVEAWLANEAGDWLRAHGEAVWWTVERGWRASGVSPTTVDEFDALARDHVGRALAFEVGVLRDAPYGAIPQLAQRWLDELVDLAPDARRWRAALADEPGGNRTWQSAWRVAERRISG